ncbi:MAG: hypothetical protein OEV25_11460 [Deltaproteobacteria bacterium]|nr:hypothetical protein [Deltaproteobacteria bacterium]
MKDSQYNSADGRPLLYHKTREDIEIYREKSVELKLQWLQAQMEFFYKAMPNEAKRIRDKLKRGEM